MSRFGIENEFTSFARDGTHHRPDFVAFDSLYLPTLYMHTHNRAWLYNGGLIYDDRGKTEYASPECETVQDVVIAEKLGDVFMKDLFSYRMEDGVKIPVEQDKFLLMKRTASRKMTKDMTWGAHESFMIPGDMWHELTSTLSVKGKILQLFLASRQLYAGAGHFSFDPKNIYHKTEFHISPRVNFLTKVLDYGTTSDDMRAIINTRNERLAESVFSNTCRLHLICGDMNRSDWSVYLKMGTTLLMLFYLELCNSNQDLCDLYDAIRLDDVLEVMHYGTRPFTSPIHFDCFRKLLRIQRICIDALRKQRRILKEYVPEAPLIFNLWARALDDVENALKTSPVHGFFSKRLDWLIKLELFEETLGESFRNMYKGNAIRHYEKFSQLDFAYHHLNQNDLYRHLVFKGDVIEMYPLSTVIRLARKPPQGRARERTKFLEYLIEKDLVGNVQNVGWERLSLVWGSDPSEYRLDIFFDGKVLSLLEYEVARTLAQLVRDGRT